jgi:hypothetical protein
VPFTLAGSVVESAPSHPISLGRRGDLWNYQELHHGPAGKIPVIDLATLDENGLEAGKISSRSYSLRIIVG